MVDGQSGKGSKYRPYSPKEWDKAWLRIFGKKCPYCTGKKEVLACWKCGGIGKVEK